MKMLKNIFPALLALFFSNNIWGQGLIHAGGSIVMTDGAFVIVDGTIGNYAATSDASISMTANSRLRVNGNWSNKGNTVVFTNNLGKVEFYGNNISIGGTKITHFPDLALQGTGGVTLKQNMLVGGGFNGGGTGLLRLNSNILNVNTYTLVINNRNPNAITYTSGGILTETSPGFGYSRLQWNIRDGSTGPIFIYPLVNASGTRLNFTLTCNSVGIQTKDSGYVSISSYHTADVAVPNNRPMPTGVQNTDNECDGENSGRMVDRFWIIEDNGYAKQPDVTFKLGYTDADLITSNNTITEANLGAIKYNTGVNKWLYPVNGTVSTPLNEVTYRTGIGFSGIWTLSDTTPYPKAAFSVKGNCEYDSIVFTDNSGVTSDKIVQWQWNFGNGKLSGLQNPFTTYTPSGLFNVRLVIRSQSGCLDTAIKRIQILAAPRAIFTVADTCENSFVKFESFSWPGSGLLKSETWSYGDNSPTETGKKVSHYYGAVGVPDVFLVVYNSNGCKDTMRRPLFIAPMPNASMSFTDNCQGTPISFSNGSTPGGGTIVKYLWNFGNGRMSYNQNDNVAFPDYGNFNVSMAVFNSFGCSDTTNKAIIIYPRAVANFDYSPTELHAADPVNFNNLSKNDDNWTWEFGDGYFDNNKYTTHSYDNYGKYRVTLISSTIHGCADTFSKDIYVKSSPLYWFPTAFTPGSTKDLNDKFGMNTTNIISKYNLMIYNRWGQILFTSTDPSDHWDGFYNNELVPIGNYVYHATFLSPEGQLQVYKGDVMVLR